MKPPTPPDLYPRVRGLMVERARRVIPGLVPTLTGYTPQEAMSLIGDPRVTAWHRMVASSPCPGEGPLVLVPCARRKPYPGIRVGSYGGYNRARLERDAGLLPPFQLVTVSEPLGAVPEHLWGEMPLYDCPGLFGDDYLRSGLKTREWVELFGQAYTLPWCDRCYAVCISWLAQALAGFVAANPGRRVIACVDTDRRGCNTHGEIVQAANEITPFLAPGDRHPRGRRGGKARYQALVLALGGAA